MRQIRVLHLLASGAVEWTAISQVVVELGRRSEPTGHRYSAWFLQSGGPLEDALEEADVATAIHPWGGRRDPRGAARMWSALRAGQFDIVHCHTGGRSVRWLLRIATSARVIVHVHAMATEAAVPDDSPLRTDGAHAVIANSAATARRVRRGNVYVVHPGVDPAAFPLRPSTRRETPIIGSASRLAAVKDLPTLLRAFQTIHAGHDQVVLEVAGDGPERSALEAETERLGLSGCVRFLGWQPDVAALHRRWSIFVQPSRTEGFGVAALEAMASGLAVVATSAGGIQELVVEGVTGHLVPPGDPDALAKAVMGLLDDPQRALDMGAAGRARAERLFTADRMVRDILDVYATLLPGRS